MSTGEKIQKYRKEKGLTQKKLGELCGIAETTIRRYELGLLNPKIETLKKIAKVLDIGCFELMEDTKISYPDIERNMSNIVDFYGEDELSRIAIEKCSGLIQAINKLHRHTEIRQRKTDLIEEIANVAIVLHQLMIMYDIDNYEFNSMLTKKKDRIMQRFEHDYEEYNEDFEI